MACTKQTYTATATWTASQLAGLFEDAFIDAGLMTGWYDSFLSGTIENRVLEVAYDGAKTYGKTYYWFMFATTGVWLHVATGWNDTGNVPTGTQYLDYFATTTNATTNHWQMFSASSANTVELMRYTSGVDADQSWFVVKSGVTQRCFTIVNDAMTVQPWMDLAKGFFAGFFHLLPTCTYSASTQARSGLIRFARGPALRRDLILGAGLNGATAVADYKDYSSEIVIFSYGAFGNTTGGGAIVAGANYRGHFGSVGGNASGYTGAIILPSNFSGTNPAFTGNSNPVFHSMPFMPYITESLPADFGLTFHYATNTFSQGDTFVATAGTEEWEVLDFAANASAVTGASPLFLARMV
jgi:hypothetical protein